MLLPESDTLLRTVFRKPNGPIAHAAVITFLKDIGVGGLSVYR